MSWNLKLDQNWFQKSPNFHQIVTKCVKNDPKMFQKCSQNVSKILQNVPKMFQNRSKIVSKCFKMFSPHFCSLWLHLFFGNILAPFGQHFGNILETLWNMLETFWKHFGKILGTFWAHFGIFRRIWSILVKIWRFLAKFWHFLAGWFWSGCFTL